MQTARTVTLDEVGQTRFDPVFIVGDHRSGTTVLYQALARTGAFNVVTAYHVIRNAEFLTDFLEGRERSARQALAAAFSARGLVNRGIDGVAVTPDLPEEYGFVIDRMPRPHVRPETLPALVDLCQRLRFTGEDRPVLLKNPWDVFTFEYLKATLPQARFIFVHRHPARVISSQLAATRSLLQARNEYVAMLAPWYGELFDQPLRLTAGRLATRLAGARIVGRHVVKAASHYLTHVESIPRRDYVEVRYEDLCAAPEVTLRRILSFLGIGAAATAAARDLVRPRAQPILPAAAARFAHLRHALAVYCERHGYDAHHPE